MVAFQSSEMVLLHSLSRSSSARNAVFSISFVLLLASSTQDRVFIQGRTKFMTKKLQKEEEGKGMLWESSVIGSRPPRCDKLCFACGQCEAVQMPAVPQKEMVSARVDDDSKSNYKPLNWKCKCGDLIFNP